MENTVNEFLKNLKTLKPTYTDEELECMVNTAFEEIDKENNTTNCENKEVNSLNTTTNCENKEVNSLSTLTDDVIYGESSATMTVDYNVVDYNETTISDKSVNGVKFVNNRIENLTIEELYYYEKLCETIIDKLIKDINCERAENGFSTMNYRHTETENEKEFNKFTKIHNDLLEEIKERFSNLKWK